MAKVTEKRKVPAQIKDFLIGYRCDKCGSTYGCEDGDYGVFETQEFLHINFTGGYASVFGDMNHVEADICQKCLKEMIKDFARISSTENYSFGIE